jgi:ribosomal silencing factor RsfS
MDDPLIPMINVIVNAADARKATSISAFRISSITEITTFMVIVEGEPSQLTVTAIPRFLKLM